VEGHCGGQANFSAPGTSSPLLSVAGGDLGLGCFRFCRWGGGGMMTPWPRRKGGRGAFPPRGSSRAVAVGGVGAMSISWLGGLVNAAADEGSMMYSNRQLWPIEVKHTQAPMLNGHQKRVIGGDSYNTTIIVFWGVNQKILVRKQKNLP
jgi:hypothetical protein